MKVNIHSEDIKIPFTTLLKLIKITDFVHLFHQIGGENIYHVEKFQLTMHDDCGEVSHSNFKYLFVFLPFVFLSCCPFSSLALWPVVLLSHCHLVPLPPSRDNSASKNQFKRY